MHRLGQSGIELPVMPDRGVAGRVTRLERANGARQAIGLAELLEHEDATPLRDQRGGERGPLGQHRQQAIAESLRVAENSRPAGRRARARRDRAGRRCFITWKRKKSVLSAGSRGTSRTVRAGDNSRPAAIEQARPHAGGGPPAVLAHGDLPDPALPGEKLIAELFGRRLHGVSLVRQGKIGRIRLRQGVSWRPKIGGKPAARAGLAANLLTGKLISCRLTASGAPPSIQATMGEEPSEDVLWRKQRGHFRPASSNEEGNDCRSIVHRGPRGTGQGRVPPVTGKRGYIKWTAI